MMTVEYFHDGVGLNIWCGEYWERHKFKDDDELETYLWSNRDRHGGQSNPRENGG